MSVTLSWNGPEKTALILSFMTPWTWEHYEAVSRDLTAAFASVSHTVDLVVDMTYAGRLPHDSLYQLRNVYGNDTPNLGRFIFVGATNEFKTMMLTADRYYTALGGQLDFCFVDALDVSLPF